jgi:CheY-like chemotaxis protein
MLTDCCPSSSSRGATREGCQAQGATESRAKKDVAREPARKPGAAGTFSSISRVEEACRVVICDDQPGFRQLVAIVLNLDPDLEVVGETADGRQAIQLVRELRPDVLLLDIAMPVMDGLEALPQIRESAPETQVVMLTGVVSESVRQRALDAGACLFLEKGIDVETLVAQIKAVCRDPSPV